MTAKTLNEIKEERLMREKRAFAPVVARGTAEGVCDIIIVNDGSGSTEEFKNDKIKAFKNYAESLKSNPKCRGICKTTIIEFADGVNLLCERLLPNELEKFIQEKMDFKCTGCTDGYKAVETVNTMIDDLSKLYNPASGVKIPHNCPRVFWVSDGEFNDKYSQAIEDYHRLMKEKRIHSYFVGLGNSFNMDIANALADPCDQIFGSYQDIDRAMKYISNSVIKGSIKPGSDSDIHFSNDNDYVLLDVTGD